MTYSRKNKNRKATAKKKSAGKIKTGKKAGIKKTTGKKKNPTYKSRKKGQKTYGQMAGVNLLLSFAILIFTKAWGSLFTPSGNAGDRVRNTEEEYRGEEILPAEKGPCGRPEIIRDYLVPNPYSRSGIALEEVKGVVVHYVANAGSTARENRNYFENLKDTHLTKASSHFIIGLEGEIIQCIPLEEISYASNNRNGDTISIECCHEKNNGKFNKKTYRSLVKLTAWLCRTYGLSSSAVIRHYDVTGKMCPKYYVKHEAAWEGFLEDIQRKLAKIVD